MKTLQESIIGRRGSESLNLPFKYDDLFVVGNIVTIRDDQDKHKESDYIVITQDTCNLNKIYKNYVFETDNYILLGYKEIGKISYWKDIKTTVFDKTHFPISRKFNYISITNIRGTIPLVEIENIETVWDLEKIYKKYNLTPVK